VAYEWNAGKAPVRRGREVFLDPLAIMYDDPDYSG
jgi:hypothetical protein